MAGSRGLRFHWRRYEKLEGRAAGQRRIEKAEFGNGRRPFWRVRIKRPRLRVLRRFSVKRFLVRIRDAYVDMMLGFANSRAISGGYGYGVRDAAVAAFGKGPVKEYDQQMIVEIYKSIIAQGQIFAAGGAGVVGVPISR